MFDYSNENYPAKETKDRIIDLLTMPSEEQKKIAREHGFILLRMLYFLDGRFGIVEEHKGG